MVRGPAAQASPWGLLQMQNLGPHGDLPIQNLPFSELLVTRPLVSAALCHSICLTLRMTLRHVVLLISIRTMHSVDLCLSGHPL